MPTFQVSLFFLCPLKTTHLLWQPRRHTCGPRFSGARDASSPVLGASRSGRAPWAESAGCPGRAGGQGLPRWLPGPQGIRALHTCVQEEHRGRVLPMRGQAAGFPSAARCARGMGWGAGAGPGVAGQTLGAGARLACGLLGSGTSDRPCRRYRPGPDSVRLFLAYAC